MYARNLHNQTIQVTFAKMPELSHLTRLKERRAEAGPLHVHRKARPQRAVAAKPPLSADRRYGFRLVAG
jgi:hypothetical protein